MWSKRKQRERAMKGAAIGVAIELLEQRRLLTMCSFSIFDLTLQVFGDGSNNLITFQYTSGTPDSLTVKEHGTAPAGCSGFSGVITVQAYGGSAANATSTGDDTINGDGMPVTIPLEFHGQDGNDSLRGSGGSDTLIGGYGGDSLYGGDGTT